MFKLKKGKLILSILLLIIVVIAASCDVSDNSDSSNTNSVKVYAGMVPRGDFITIEISNSAISINNHTDPDLSFNAVSYSEMSGAEGGLENFSILYQTSSYNETGDFIKFALMKDMGIVFQAFNSSNYTIDYYGYALLQKPMELSDLKPEYGSPKYFNIIEFINGEHARVNYTDAFSADIGNGNGIMNMCKYDIKEAHHNNFGIDSATGIPYGVGHATSDRKKPEPFEWSVWQNLINPETGLIIKEHYDNGVFDYMTTIAATASGVLIEDRGYNNGGMFFIPQTESPEFKPEYAGTYLVFGFDLEHDYSDDSNNELESYALTLENKGNGNGQGKVQTILGKESEENDFELELLVPLEDLQASDWLGDINLPDAMKAVLNMGNETPEGVDENHIGYGVFVLVKDDDATFLIMDPSGDYVFFMTSYVSSGELKYKYGFGVKDPNYKKL